MRIAPPGFDVEDPFDGTPSLIAVHAPGNEIGRFWILETGVYLGHSSDGRTTIDPISCDRTGCVIEPRDGNWWVTVWNRASIVRVNDERVAVDRCLADNDRIAVDRTIYRILLGRNQCDRRHEEIYRSTIIDGLTNAHNKRYFLENALERDFSRSRRHKREMSLVVFGVDGMSEFNRMRDLAKGDLLLRKLARTF